VFVNPVIARGDGQRTFGDGVVRQIFLLHANLLVTPGGRARDRRLVRRRDAGSSASAAW
jgi:hypothetical protein